MFELPNAKRVRRGTVSSADHSSSSGREDTSDVEHEALHIQDEAANAQHSDSGHTTGSMSVSATELPDAPIDYGFSYEFIDTVNDGPNEVPKPALLNDEEAQASKQEADPDDAEDRSKDQAQTYEFSLFKPEVKTDQLEDGSGQAPKHYITIRPRSPTPTLAEAGIVRQRPDGYYFTSSAPPETQQTLKSQYAASAMSTADLIKLSQQPHQGMTMPWRVIHVAASRLVTPKGVSEARIEGLPAARFAADEDRRRARPSKKRRTLLRQRVEARKQAMKSAEEQAKAAELAEREKRARRNREKKFKKRDRDKKKKLEARLSSGGGGDDGVNSDAGSPEAGSPGSRD